MKYFPLPKTGEEVEPQGAADVDALLFINGIEEPREFFGSHWAIPRSLRAKGYAAS